MTTTDRSTAELEPIVTLMAIYRSDTISSFGTGQLAARFEIRGRPHYYEIPDGHYDALIAQELVTISEDDKVRLTAKGREQVEAAGYVEWRDGKLTLSSRGCYWLKRGIEMTHRRFSAK